MTKPKILLSFDLEEFDLPEEYGNRISASDQLEISMAGLAVLVEILKRHDACATFFVTANFAQNYPDVIREISQRHEIASHAFYHSQYEADHLLSSRLALEEIIGKRVHGFRMPRLRPVSAAALFAAGYSYNSSLNPTYIPGRYNNLFSPRTYFFEDNLLQIPASVAPLVRFPLFWLSVKLLPLRVLRALSSWTMGQDGYLCTYSHPWEFANLADAEVPKYIKRLSGDGMAQKFEDYVGWLGGRGDFVTCWEFSQSVFSAEQGIAGRAVGSGVSLVGGSDGGKSAWEG